MAQGTIGDPRGLPVLVDIVWWGTVGLVVAVLAGPVGRWWGISPPVLAFAGVALGVSGIPLWLWVRRRRPMPRPIVVMFGAMNLALVPVLVALAAFRLTALTPAGNGALWVAGVLVLGLGAWQLRVARPRGASR